MCPALDLEGAIGDKALGLGAVLVAILLNDILALGIIDRAGQHVEVSGQSGLKSNDKGIVVCGFNAQLIYRQLARVNGREVLDGLEEEGVGAACRGVGGTLQRVNILLGCDGFAVLPLGVLIKMECPYQTVVADVPCLGVGRSIDILVTVELCTDQALGGVCKNGAGVSIAAAAYVQCGGLGGNICVEYLLCGVRNIVTVLALVAVVIRAVVVAAGGKNGEAQSKAEDQC